VTGSDYKFYNSGSALGIVGTVPAHCSNKFTYLPTTMKWIRTEDLYKTREEAKTSSPAKFLR